MPLSTKHLELAKKLKALADKGIGGEKHNAEAMLTQLLKKYNITIEEIEGEKINEYFFKINNNPEYELWIQITYLSNKTIKRYGEFPKSMIKKYKIEGNYAIKCTASEYVEIEAKFDFYKKLYREEHEIFLRSFFRANDLLAPSDENDKDKDKPPTKKEIEQYYREINMASKIKTAPFRKQLTT